MIAGVWVSDSGTYFDSVPGYPIQYRITAFHEDTIRLDTSICPGDTLWVNDRPYVMDGTYVDTLTGTGSCHIILELNLGVLPNSATSIDTIICYGTTITTGGIPKTSSGTYSDTVTNYRGCDSVITTNLTVLPFPVQVIDTTICDGEFVTTGGTTKTRSGTYSDTVTNHRGCDSVITTNLTVCIFLFWRSTQPFVMAIQLSPVAVPKLFSGVYTDTLIAVLAVIP